MSGFLRIYRDANLDIICAVIRIVIGIIMLVSLKNRVIDIKKFLVTIYYGLIGGCILGCLLNPVMINIVIGGIFGLFLSLCVSIFYKGDIVTSFILFFITIYEILETIFYVYKINFSVILKTYDDIFADYTTMYIKLSSSIFLSIIACIIYSKIKGKNDYRIPNKLRNVFFGNYFILGALFASMLQPSDVPGDWKDVFIPLLNVNYSPYLYAFPILEIVILIIVLAYKHS